MRATGTISFNVVSFLSTALLQVVMTVFLTSTINKFVIAAQLHSCLRIVLQAK